MQWRVASTPGSRTRRPSGPAVPDQPRAPHPAWTPAPAGWPRSSPAGQRSSATRRGGRSARPARTGPATVGGRTVRVRRCPASRTPPPPRRLTAHHPARICQCRSDARPGSPGWACRRWRRHPGCPASPVGTGGPRIPPSRSTSPGCAVAWRHDGPPDRGLFVPSCDCADGQSRRRATEPPGPPRRPSARSGAPSGSRPGPERPLGQCRGPGGRMHGTAAEFHVTTVPRERGQCGRNTAHVNAVDR